MSRAPVASHIREEVLAAAQTGASYLSIAQRYGISERAIRNWADDAGMPRRRSGKPAPDTNTTQGPTVNFIPTAQTKAIAHAIIRETPEHGADAVTRHLPFISPRQSVALLALLAKEAAATRMPDVVIHGAEQTDTRIDILTEPERREAHAAFQRGERADWVVAGEREYQRIRNRRLRAERKAAKAAAKVAHEGAA